MTKVQALAPDLLYRRCDPESLPFATTSELDEPDEVLGQERALEALRFGIGMTCEGYNLFALGPPGLGKHGVVRRFIEDEAKDTPVPSDWCYVNDFEEPQRPKALRLPPGVGCKLRGDMEHLVQDLRAAIAAAFHSDEYRGRRESIENEVKHDHETALEAIRNRADERGIALVRTPAGLGKHGVVRRFIEDEAKDTPVPSDWCYVNDFE